MGSLMGLIGSVIVVIAALAQCTAAETTHIVGDSAGWTVQSYDSWASGKTFAVGDKLNFTFNAQAHDVAQVSKTAYDSCTSTSTIFLGTTSPTIITLNSTGEHYYICTFTGHCAGGQKLSINVVSSTTSPGPSPPPTAGSTPPTASPPTAGSTPPTAGSTPPTASPPTAGSTPPTAGSTPPTANSPSAGSTPPSPSSAPSRAAAFGGAGAFMAVLTALFL